MASYRLTGYLTHLDEFDKLHFQFPYVSTGVDINNTFKILMGCKKKWVNYRTPLRWQEFLVKFKGVMDPMMLQQLCDVDVIIKKYNCQTNKNRGISIAGWFIKLNYIQLHKKKYEAPLKLKIIKQKNQKKKQNDHGDDEKLIKYKVEKLKTKSINVKICKYIKPEPYQKLTGFDKLNGFDKLFN